MTIFRLKDEKIVGTKLPDFSNFEDQHDHSVIVNLKNMVGRTKINDLFLQQLVIFLL